jgi:hypothetical protein
MRVKAEVMSAGTEAQAHVLSSWMERPVRMTRSSSKETVDRTKSRAVDSEGHEDTLLKLGDLNNQMQSWFQPHRERRSKRRMPDAPKMNEDAPIEMIVLVKVLFSNRQLKQPQMSLSRRMKEAWLFMTLTKWTINAETDCQRLRWLRER